MPPPTPPQPAGKPAAEVAIDADLIRLLLAEQHADLADQPLSRLAEGWDNVMFRLGEAQMVRLPRRAVAAELLENEQRWLPELAAHLPLPIPAPMRIGQPSTAYPWSWSVLPFLPGAPLDEEALDSDQGVVLGGFLKALHSVAPPSDAPINVARGGPLTDRKAGFDDRAARLAAQGLLPEHVSHLWREGLEAPRDIAPTWLHGDLHPLNLLAQAGRLTAVIDWGDICAGDPACDLGCLWVLLSNPGARHKALAAYGDVSPATLTRARGWAAYIGVVLLDSGLINSPRHARIGETIFVNLAQEL